MNKAIVAAKDALPSVKSSKLGLENVSAADLLLPRLILTQSLSKFVAEDGMAAGKYVNSLTKEIIENTEFVPVIASKYWDLLKPEGSRMVFEARVTDEFDGRLQGRRFFTDKETGEKADVNTVLAVISIVKSVVGEQAILIPFSKSSYKAGKMLLTLAQGNSGNLFSHVYRLTAKKETKNQNTYYVSDVAHVREATEEEERKAYDLYSAMAPKAKNITSAGVEADATEEAPF